MHWNERSKKRDLDFTKLASVLPVQCKTPHTFSNKFLVSKCEHDILFFTCLIRFFSFIFFSQLLSAIRKHKFIKYFIFNCYSLWLTNILKRYEVCVDLVLHNCTCVYNHILNWYYFFNRVILFLVSLFIPCHNNLYTWYRFNYVFVLYN